MPVERNLVGIQLDGASWRTELAPVAEVVGREQRLPADFIADSGIDVTAAFAAYAAPLVAPLPRRRWYGLSEDNGTLAPMPQPAVWRPAAPYSVIKGR